MSLVKILNTKARVIGGKFMNDNEDISLEEDIENIDKDQK